jgi:hypothetical protein
MAEPVLAVAVGIINGVNVDFTTPSPYYPGTVFAYINGYLQVQSGVYGWYELGTNMIRMKVAPQVGDYLHFYYQTQPPIGGSIVSPPDFIDSIELKPVVMAIDLRPRIISTEEM